jgi:hypothetical protein
MFLPLIFISNSHPVGVQIFSSTNKNTLGVVCSGLVAALNLVHYTSDYQLEYCPSSASVRVLEKGHTSFGYVLDHAR